MPCHVSVPAANRGDERGMMLLEALVAMAIVAMVTISYIGIRTTALIDATSARDWRLAREIAEEKLSELKAGAHEVPPQSGMLIPIEKYEGFSYKVVMGEAEVSEIESEIASNAAGDNQEAQDRNDWNQSRNDLREAQRLGLSAQDYEDRNLQDINDRLAESAPSADEFEDVAVVVYFPKVDGDFPEQEEALLIKARVSTLAISGLTPDQAQSLAEARGESADPAAGGAPEAGGGNTNPFGGGGR